MKSGQLDVSQLTLNDIKAIKHIFVEMLQAVYHPRIDYKKATTAAPTQERPAVQVRTTQAISAVKPEAATGHDMPTRSMPRVEVPEKSETAVVPVVSGLDSLEDDDDKPMPDVPTLPRVNDAKSSNSKENGAAAPTDEAQSEKDG